MRINDAEAKRRLTSSKNLARLADVKPEVLSPAPTPPPQEPVEHVHVNRAQGRPMGSKNVPEFLREAIGHLKDSGAPTESLVEAFGVNKQVVYESVRGTVGGNPPNAARRAKVIERRLNIQDQALIKLMESLDLIDTDKLSDSSAKELSGIAVNLAKVSQLSNPDAGDAGHANILIYAPQLRDEGKFKVIEVDH